MKANEIEFTSIQDIIIKKLMQKIDEHLKKYVLEKLKQLGYQFNNESDFLDFVSKRVTRIAFEDRPQEYELYLDYTSDNKKLIGIYNEKISYKFEDNLVTVTIG
jgi:hypothetical protein